MADTPEHLVKSYEQELSRLRGLVTQMGGMVEAQAANAARAVMEHNATAAAYAVQDDLGACSPGARPISRICPP